MMSPCADGVVWLFGWLQPWASDWHRTVVYSLSWAWASSVHVIYGCGRECGSACWSTHAFVVTKRDFPHRASTAVAVFAPSHVVVMTNIIHSSSQSSLFTHCTTWTVLVSKCIQKLPRCLRFQLQHEYTLKYSDASRNKKRTEVWKNIGSELAQMWNE